LSLKNDTGFIARDAFYRWKARAKKATRSVTIFTPYLDHVAGLVLDAAREVAMENRTLVTTLDADALLQSPGQLFALRRILRRGYSVLSIEGLHAKVLLIDDWLVTVGSQNFTSRGRKNRECTALAHPPASNVTFVASLILWRQNAQPVDEDLIERLIAQLTPNVRKYKNLVKETQSLIDQCREGWLQAREEAHRRAAAAALEAAREAERARLAALERQSKVQLRQSKVLVELREVGDWDNRYDSLVVCARGSLIDWTEIAADGRRIPYQLKRCAIYPAYLPDQARLAFVRLVKSRITYFRDSVKWTTKRFELGDRMFNVEVKFPSNDCQRINIVLALKQPGVGVATLSVRLSGGEAALVETKVHAEDSRRITRQLLREYVDAHLAIPGALDAVLERCFDRFHYSSLGIAEKNVRKYLDDGYYQISIIQFRSAPMLLIAKV
jgi:hypothetical protein